MAKKLGRPTKYNEEMLERAQHYVDEGYQEQDNIVPSVAGLACYLDVSKVRLYEWADKNEPFRNTLDAVHRKQEMMLADGGLSNKYNSNICKLMMANHGYSDKQQTELSGPGGGPIETNDTTTATKLASILAQVEKRKDEQSND